MVVRKKTRLNHAGTLPANQSAKVAEREGAKNDENQPRDCA
jgi:hypothetical protein